jgi:hypothetical protein
VQTGSIFFRGLFTHLPFSLNIYVVIVTHREGNRMLFEYKKKDAKDQLILTDGRTKAEADAKLKEMVKNRGDLIKDWTLAWTN